MFVMSPEPPPASATLSGNVGTVWIAFQSAMFPSMQIRTLLHTSAAAIVNVSAGVDEPPPGVVLNTVTFAVPAEATSLARIDAVRCVESTKVVVRAEPFQRTTDEAMKFDPSTASVKALAPAVVCDGRIAVVVGTGLFTVSV